MQSIQYPKWSGDDAGVFGSRAEPVMKVQDKDIDTIIRLPPLPSPLWSVDMTQSAMISDKRLLLSFDVSARDGITTMVMVQPIVLGKMHGDCLLTIDTKSFELIGSKHGQQLPR